MKFCVSRKTLVRYYLYYLDIVFLYVFTQQQETIHFFKKESSELASTDQQTQGIIGYDQALRGSKTDYALQLTYSR